MRTSVYLLLAPTLLFTGCASIVNGQNQSVSVEARNEAGAVAAANCKLTNNKGTWYLTTPGSAVVHRSYEDLYVSCEKESHAPGIVSVKSSTKGMAFGNILFGGVIGATVDISTGAAYDYPTLITVAMTKASAEPVPAAMSASAPSAAASAALSMATPVAPAAPAASAAG